VIKAQFTDDDVVPKNPRIGNYLLVRRSTRLSLYYNNQLRDYNM